MRSPLSSSPPPRDERVGGPGTTTRSGIALVSRLAVAVASIAATMVATVPAGAQTSPPGSVAEADVRVAALRRQADALSGRYFEALGELAVVQHRIEDIEARLPALADEVAALRTSTRTRAVVAYKRSGANLASVLGAEDPMAAARRVQWLGRLNARDAALSDALRATSARLSTQRTELRAARDAAAAALEDVRAQGAVIDALLVDAEERRRIAATPASTVPATGVADAAASPTVASTVPGPTTTSVPSPPPTSAPSTYSPTPGTHPHHDDPFLVCLRTRESSGNYAAYNPAGPYMGAYQFLQSTWNSAANHAGRTNLIGVAPNVASPYDQDDVAWSLYQWQGSAPWGGVCDPA